MSILDTLYEQGLTQEDLEKAASARLFAEAAAAEGIDLSELTEDQAEELYDFWANNEVEAEKAASANAFFEAAAAEGIDLNELTEDQVGELYDFWANGGEEAEKAASAEDLLAEAAVKEASAKLAEAEYIGRYMARVYADEMGKIAADDKTAVTQVAMATRGRKAMEYLKANKGKAVGGAALLAAGGYGAKKLMSKSPDEKQSSIDELIEERALELLKEAAEEESATQAATKMSMGTRGRKAMEYLKANKGKAVGGAALLAAGGYGAKKLMDRRKASNEKAASALEELIEERALELLKEAAESEEAKGTKHPVLKSTGIGALTGAAVGGAGGTAMGHKLQGLYGNGKLREKASKVLAEGGADSSVRKAVREGASAIRKAPLKKVLGGAGAVGLGALGAGAGLMHGVGRRHGRKDMEKDSSIDELIEERALEMLEEAQLASEIDEAALELLAENGFLD